MGFGLGGSSTEKDRKWNGIIGRREIFGKIPLINYVHYLTTVSALTGQLQPNPIFTEFENTGGIISDMNKSDSF